MTEKTHSIRHLLTLSRGKPEDYSKVDSHAPFMVAQASNGDLMLTVEKTRSILINPDLEVFDLYPREDGKIEAKLRNNRHTSSIDLPEDTVVWSRWPELEYNPDMLQKNRIEIIADERNSNYILKFVRITWENGAEKEDEAQRIVFKDKQALLEFKKNAIEVLSQFN